MTTTDESLVAAARESTGLGTVHRALDGLVELYALEDAAVVVDVRASVGRCCTAGRRPGSDDEHGCTRWSPACIPAPARGSVLRG